jgi:hypothetical protein
VAAASSLIGTTFADVAAAVDGSGGSATAPVRPEGGGGATAAVLPASRARTALVAARGDETSPCSTGSSGLFPPGVGSGRAAPPALGGGGAALPSSDRTAPFALIADAPPCAFTAPPPTLGSARGFGLLPPSRERTAPRVLTAPPLPLTLGPDEAFFGRSGRSAIAEWRVTFRVRRGSALGCMRSLPKRSPTKAPSSWRLTSSPCFIAIFASSTSKAAASFGRLAASFSSDERMSLSSSGGHGSDDGSFGTSASRMRSRVEMSELPANRRSPVIISYRRMPTL